MIYYYINMSRLKLRFVLPAQAGIYHLDFKFAHLRLIKIIGSVMEPGLRRDDEMGERDHDNSQ